ncbi:MAG: peptidoglycan DD-metalloendopeptidase family protein [Patescibacteria group bacterium]
MTQLSLRPHLLLVFLVFVISIFIPLSVHAQSRYGGYSSSLRNKINDLDDDAVKNLPVPILFGVTLRMITPNFGDSRGDGTREHEGLDIMAPKGAPIISPTDAVVTRTGSGASSGKYVYTANPGGETFIYMHLDEIEVKTGDELDEGDLIGFVGNTGNASGGAHHLHLEIRDGRRATDPHPRISIELSLKDKIKFLKNVIREVDDEDDFIEFIVETYLGELWQAKAVGIELPNDVEDELEDLPVITPAGATTPGDLTLDSQGSAVVTLQGFLIAKDTGPAARALSTAGATGYFGPITQRALIEYQLAHGISPASGYFGPRTRAYILANE